MGKDLFSLKGKIIVVTGGAGVLGSAFCDAVSEAGGTVIIGGRTEETCLLKAASINQNGGMALGLKMDVLDEQSLQQACDIILEKYGRIDGLVNAAGGNVAEAVLQNDQDVFALNIDGMKKALDLNLWGTVLPVQVFGRAMAKAGQGSIINISSVTPKRALTKVLGYSMGKAAIEIYTKWMAVEAAARYGEGIRVNSISPGFFLTKQNKDLLTRANGSYTERAQKILRNSPFAKFGKPDDVKGAVVYLLSDASAFVTGADLVVDGGFLAFSGV